jgi:hypothetical protein
MTIVQNLITELREKRLWPVAVALILALIAVPVVLSSSGGTVAAAPAPAAIGSAAAPAVPAVSVTTTPSNARLTGPERNPFAQQVKPSSDTAGAGTGTAPTSSGAPTSSSVGSSAKSTPVSTTTPASKPATTTPTTPVAAQPAVKYLYFEVDLVYDRTGAVPQTRDNIARLTPLPRASNPMIVYLGVEKDKRTALFLVSQNVRPTGKGKCLPTRSDCQFLALKAGQADLFKVIGASGTEEFTISLTAVKTLSTTSRKVAAAAWARESKAGAKILARETGHSIAHMLVYAKQAGTLSLHHLSRKSVTRPLPTQGPVRALGVTLQPRTSTP